MDKFASNAHAINRDRSVTPSEVVVIGKEESGSYVNETVCLVCLFTNALHLLSPKR